MGGMGTGVRRCEKSAKVRECEGAKVRENEMRVCGGAECGGGAPSEPAGPARAGPSGAPRPLSHSRTLALSHFSSVQKVQRHALEPQQLVVLAVVRADGHQGDS